MQGTFPENATPYHDANREIICNKAGEEGNQYNQHTWLGWEGVYMCKGREVQG